MFKIVRVCVLAAGVLVVCAASGVTATKEWVQTATNAVMQTLGPRIDAVDTKFAGYVPLVGNSTIRGALNVYGNLYANAGTFMNSVSFAEGISVRDGVMSYFGEPSELSFMSIGETLGDLLDGKADTNTVQNMGATVAAWQTYWDGDDVRVTVTNYYGQTGIPRLYLEEKMQPDGDHAEPWFKTVWDEMTRWNAFLSDYLSVTNFVRQNLADRAWGVYDSSSGAYSPDDLLQLSQPSIQIAAGMAWQKTVLTSGSVWVLKATTPATIAGTAANGFMRLLDGDGNTMVEIIKGDKRIVGATATGLSMSGSQMTITYSVTSSDHPTISLCTDLADPSWVEEGGASAPASVAWSGSSGAWVATVTPIGNRPSMFARATYETGGSTYLNAAVPIGFSKVVIGGQEYTVSTATISGQRVLVLQ